MNDNLSEIPSNKKKVFMRYGLCILIGGMVTMAYVLSHDFASQDLVNKYMILCDGFTIPGFLMICFGALILASNAGGMDGFTYGIKHAARMLIPGRSVKDKEDSFYDYVQKRKAKRIRGYGFMFFTGLGFMAVAAVFLVLFYQVYQG